MSPRRRRSSRLSSIVRGRSLRVSRAAIVGRTEIVERGREHVVVSCLASEADRLVEDRERRLDDRIHRFRSRPGRRRSARRRTQLSRSRRPPSRRTGSPRAGRSASSSRLLEGEVAGSVEELRARLRRRIRRQPRALAGASGAPRRRGRACTRTATAPRRASPASVGFVVGEEPVQALAEVVVVILQTLQPRRLLGALQERLGTVRRPPGTTPHAAARCASASPEASSRSAANSRIVSSIQKRSSVKRRRLFSTSDCSVSRSASATSSAASSVHPPAKTESARNRRCSSAREEVVRPLDRRAQRLLAGLGVPAALEQVEPLGQALEDLSRGKHRRAGGSQLDRERQPVQTSQSSAIAPRARAGSARRRARPPPTRREEAPRTRPRPAPAAARGS